MFQNLCVLNTGKFRDQKCSRAHHRRRQLAICGRRNFNRSSLFRRKTSFLH